MNPFKKLLAAGVSETLKEGTKLIDEVFTTQEEKLDAKKELFRTVIVDRQSARQMYTQDSWLQKAFALFFLAVWSAMTYIILNYFVFNELALQEWQIAFVSMLWGGMNTKLSTIVDFLFGGSAEKNLTETRKKKKNTPFGV